MPSYSEILGPVLRIQGWRCGAENRNGVRTLKPAMWQRQFEWIFHSLEIDDCNACDYDTEVNCASNEFKNVL